MDFGFVNQFSQVKLLVAGEVGIDEYIWGDTRRISPEAPVPVVEVESTSRKLGLAANVAQNVASLGGNISLFSLRGQDEDGLKLEALLRENGVTQWKFVNDPSRPTPRKVRVIAQKQHVVRVDYERSHGLDPRLAQEFTQGILDSLDSVDGVIVQDYGKGLWNADTMAFVREARAKKKPIFVDPSRNSPLSLYQGVTLLTPNLVEAEALTGQPHLPSKQAGRDDGRLTKMGQLLVDGTGAEHAIITCGESGMVALSHGSTTLTRMPTFAREVFDVTGAGDTVVAVLAMTSLLGLPLRTCMAVANAAAGIVVGQIGAASVTPAELKVELERLAETGLI